MTDLGRRALALRGAVAAAGLAVAALSMTHVVDTMAAPAAVRTATLSASTANYFPTPLPPSIDCADDAEGLGGALVSWPSAGPGLGYRVQLWNGAAVVQTSYTDQTSYRPTASAESTYRVVVSTVNSASGTSDAARVVSTGSRSHDVSVGEDLAVQCVAGSADVVPNQPWENQAEWTPPAASESAGESMFVSLADELTSGDLADALPAEDPAGDLTEVGPATLPQPTDPADGGSPARSESPSPAAPEASTEAASPSASAPESTDAASSPSPSTEPAPTDVPSAGSPSPADAEQGENAAPTREAALGDGPIAVGAAEARLDEVDGEPHVIVTSDGSEVCSAAVPGATSIAESEGELVVMVAGRPRVVDPATCEIA